MNLSFLFISFSIIQDSGFISESSWNRFHANVYLRLVLNRDSNRAFSGSIKVTWNFGSRRPQKRVDPEFHPIMRWSKQSEKMAWLKPLVLNEHRINFFCWALHFFSRSGEIFQAIFQIPWNFRYSSVGH